MEPHYHGALSTMDDLRPSAIRHLIKNDYSKLKITEPIFRDFGKSKTWCLYRHQYDLPERFEKKDPLVIRIAKGVAS